jgi:hypothetical protein
MEEAFGHLKLAVIVYLAKCLEFKLFYWQEIGIIQGLKRVDHPIKVFRHSSIIKLAGLVS